MNIAFLFNANAKKYGSYYGGPIKRKVFGLGILQRSKRHMKISVGDVLIFSHAKTWARYDELCENVYFSGSWSRLHERRLRATFRTAMVYALTFQNMTKDLALELHQALTPDRAYLGMLEVDYTYGPHLALFRNSMITLYRIEGESCRIFYSMGDIDGRDDHEISSMQALGFNDVGWEDRGAHGTIFDDYDTLDDFERVAAFKEAITPFMKNGADEASELVMVLEDLNPHLFNALGAAVAALERGKTEEEIAQAATSGRRYIEKLADVLFPARSQLYKNRQVGKAQYRNRIWAFIQNNTVDSPHRSKILGKEIDRVDGEFNAGVHGDQDKSRILHALADAAIITSTLLTLNPSDTRKPYFAYRTQIIKFLKEATKPRKERSNASPRKKK